MVGMKKRLGVVPPACGATLPRRDVIRRVGSWVIFSGTVTAAACGRTPLGDPIDGIFPGDDDDDDGTTPSPTQTLTPTPTPEACSCDPVSGSPTGLFVADLSVGSFAASSALSTFICRDNSGFYAMADNCLHTASNHIIDNGTFNESNLAAGFRCNYHGSQYGANGNVTNGPAPLGSFLIHYLLTIHPTTNELHLDKARLVEPTCRCTV